MQRQVALFKEAQVDPGFEKVAQRNEASVQHNVFTTVGRRGAFRLPYGHGSTQSTHTPSEDEAADDELSKLEAGALQYLANERQTGSQEDDLSASEPVSDPGTRQSTKESTNGEGGDDGALLGRVAALLGAMRVNGVDLGEVVVPVSEGEQTTDTGLVVSEQHKGRQDDEQKLRRLESFATESHGG